MKKNLQIKLNPEDIEQLDLFDEEEDNSSLETYEDLGLEFISSTRRKFLTWNEF